MAKTTVLARAESGSSTKMIWLAMGLGVFGLSTFGFLSLAGKTLGSGKEFTALSLVWTILMALGVGLYMPLEQEVAREVAMRVSTGAPTRPAIRGPIRYAVGSLAILIIVGAVGIGPISDAFFGSDRSMVLVLLGAMVSMAVSYLVRGTLSGSGRFKRYGVQLALDGGLRIAGAGGLLSVTTESAWHFGIVLVAAPLVATILVTPLKSPLVTRDGDHRPRQGSGAMTSLVIASVLSQALSNAGAIAIALLANQDEGEVAGNFVSAITVVRIPLFLFAIIQAAFLPALAKQVALHAVRKFTKVLRLTTWLTATIGVAGIAVIWFFGQDALRLIFTETFVIDRFPLVLVASSSAAYMLAQVLAQALLAHRQDRSASLGWAVGVVGFLLALMIPAELSIRVALALTIGSTITAMFDAVALRIVLHRWKSSLPTGIELRQSVTQSTR